MQCNLLSGNFHTEEKGCCMGAWLIQSVERAVLALAVVSLSPTLGKEITYKQNLNKKKKQRRKGVVHSRNGGKVACMRVFLCTVRGRFKIQGKM